MTWDNNWNQYEQLLFNNHDFNSKISQFINENQTCDYNNIREHELNTYSSKELRK